MGDGIKRVIAAAKRTRVKSAGTAKPTRKDLERAALAALVRCGVAAVAQSKADAGMGIGLSIARLETNAAGAALAKAIRAMRGAK